MDYCEHCEGQRFDRARVLRALRQIRQQMRTAARPECDEAFELALRAVRELDIPHLDLVELEDEIIH
jgi:BMFP domain-containing protein YqiC